MRITLTAFSNSKLSAVILLLLTLPETFEESELVISDGSFSTDPLILFEEFLCAPAFFIQVRSRQEIFLGFLVLTDNSDISKYSFIQHLRYFFIRSYRTFVLTPRRKIRQGNTEVTLAYLADASIPE